ncbi:MAG: hypothetical protein IKQ39_00585 [Oscillospiraceae bacterium]|nr:hypothetical protein [Oscillospiraceae bacterium]
MGMLTMKYNSAEMAQKLAMMLQPGENLIAAVYCTVERGFFEVGSRIMTGYLGITDQHRLVGFKIGMIGETPITAYLQCAQKLRIKKGLFNSYRLTMKADNFSLNCQISRKGGKRFPDQSDYLDLMLPILEMYQR